MQEQLISFETAKLAELKKYSISSITHFNDDFTVKNIEYINLPTQSLLQKWLREVHNIHINVSPLELSDGWRHEAFEIKRTHYDSFGVGFGYKTYEEALEAGLKKSILNINN